MDSMRGFSVWALAAFLAVAGAAGCRKAKSAGSFEGISMTQADGKGTASLASCPTRRCLTVYVAPWCGYCRSATPMIRELRGVLRKNGMEARVVIGLDREPALRDYARAFDDDALLDLAGAFDPGGVPHFYVSDGTGAVLRQVAGLPQDPRALLSWLAQD